MLRNSEELRGGVLRNSVDNSLKSPSPVDKPHGGSCVGHREKPRSGLQRLRHFPGDARSQGSSGRDPYGENGEASGLAC